MNPTPNEENHSRTTTEVLTAFDGPLAPVASGIARGEYTFWLGSGLSRGVVPAVPDLLLKLLSFLQARVDVDNPECGYRLALNTILKVARLQDDEIGMITFEAPVKEWPGIDRIVTQLCDRYSVVLDVGVDGEADPDFLIWEGIDVRTTYGSPSLTPDAEHLCIAILILEGVVDVAATTNWDGLVEAAIHELSSTVDPMLRVIIDQEDLRNPSARCDLVKIHGCAVKAAQQPDVYRRHIIGRQSQIDNWAENPQYTLIKEHLVNRLATKTSLIIGLSAQDHNIRAVLSAANNRLPWSWPDKRSAVTFAVEELGIDQASVLKQFYSDGDYQRNAAEIDVTARLGAYAQPTLIALVIYTLFDKLATLLEHHQVPHWNPNEIIELQLGLTTMRDLVASRSDNDAATFIRRLTAAVAFILATFRKGEPPSPESSQYEPLTAQPISQTVADPNAPTEELRDLAVIAALLGKGTALGHWTIEIGDAARPHDGVCALISPDLGRTKVFLVDNAVTLSKLESAGYVNLNDPAVLVMHAAPLFPRQKRSPTTHYGRTGGGAGREVSIPAILRNTNTASELFDRLRLDAGI